MYYKHFFFLISLFFTCMTLVTNAQSVEVSTHVSDQIVQGPCYIFATIAALESKAIENGAPNTVNFNEWQFYSNCAMGANSSGPKAMINKTVEHMAAFDAHSAPHSSPTAFSCPNPNDQTVPCIADFDCLANATWCQNNMIYHTAPSSSCSDNEGKRFDFVSNGGIRYSLTPDVNNNYLTTIDLTNLPSNQKKDIISKQLGKKNGVIANFSSFGNGVSHSIFLYKVENFTWYWKDSWPGNAGLKQGSIPWKSLSNIYFITGDVAPVGGGSTTCNQTIDGNSVVRKTEYYSISTGIGTSQTWSVSSGLTIVSGQGTNAIAVIPNTCIGLKDETITVYYNNGQCSTQVKVDVDGRSPLPTQIAVLSPNWYNGQTCPNTILELEALTPQVSGNLTYNWSISGATLLSGQGTKSVRVRTYSGSQNLSFSVRTRRNSCPYSGWTTLSGYSSPNNPACGNGGGGLRVSANQIHFDKFFTDHPEIQTAQLGVYSISGKQYYSGRLDAANASLPIDEIQGSGIIIIKLVDPVSGVSKSFKHWISK